MREMADIVCLEQEAAVVVEESACGVSCRQMFFHIVALIKRLLKDKEKFKKYKIKCD
jgi:hypothetical protein